MKRRGGGGPHPIYMHVDGRVRQHRVLPGRSRQGIGVARPKSPGSASDGTIPEDGLPHAPERELRAEPLDWRVR